MGEALRFSQGERTPSLWKAETQSEGGQARWVKECGSTPLGRGRRCRARRSFIFGFPNRANGGSGQDCDLMVGPYHPAQGAQPRGHDGIPAGLRQSRFSIPQDGPPGRGGPLLETRNVSRLRRPRRASPRGSEPRGVRPLRSRLHSRCCRGTRNAQVKGQTHRRRTGQPQTLQSLR